MNASIDQLKDQLDEDNTAFYSTASAGYAIYAATSLLTIRRYVPDAKLYIISSGLSDYDKRVLEKNNIVYHEVDLQDRFTQTWDYPIDCYYIFAGPEFLKKQGYDYSVYVDGDVLCDSNPLKLPLRIKAVAGVASSGIEGEYTSIFGDDWKKIKDIWSLPSQIPKRKRVNSGVVYFNNQEMSHIHLLDKATELFQKCLVEGIPRKGDDSLFSLLQYVYIQQEDVTFLPAEYNYILQFFDWQYPVHDLKFFHFSIDKPWKKHPYIHADAKLDKFNPYVKAWRLTFRNIAWRAWLKSSWLIGHKSFTFERSLHFIIRVKRIIRDQGLWMFGLRRSFFTRRRNARKSPISTYWWRGLSGAMNFGDEITKDILKGIFGYECRLSSIDACQLIGVGSILEIAYNRQNVNPIHVWGSGFLTDGESIENTKNLIFHAVRGAKTLSRIRNDATLGDPGLLVSLIYKKSDYQSQKIGVVAHYADADMPIMEKIRNDPRFTVINPLDRPEDIAMKITSCKLILSSSLHGLVFSDSFAIPNAHILLSDKLVGGVYKFDDYYTAIRRESKEVDIEKIFQQDYLDQLVDSYVRVKHLRVIQRNLIKSFPKVW